jgi:type I restriction enzyme S subunit
LTIENGIVEKTDRYNREFLLKNREENQYRVVHTGDFVFNPMNLRFGAIAISNIPRPVAVSAYYNVLIPNHKLIDNNFMLEILKSKRMIQIYNNIGKGSLVEKKRVHLKDFMKIKVPIPSLEQQKRIAYTISFLSEEETLLTRKLKLFQTQKQGLMQQLLTGKIRIQTP